VRVDRIAHNSTPLSKLRFAGESSALASTTRISRSSRASLPFAQGKGAQHALGAGEAKTGEEVRDGERHCFRAFLLGHVGGLLTGGRRTHAACRERGLGGGLAEVLPGVDRPPRRPVLGHLIHRQGEGRVETMFVAVGADFLAELVLLVRAIVINGVGLSAQSTHRTSGGYGLGIPGGSGEPLEPCSLAARNPDRISHPAFPGVGDR
jgi:hypothetical protein